jgi:hypothetical protein
MINSVNDEFSELAGKVGALCEGAQLQVRERAIESHSMRMCMCIFLVPIFVSHQEKRVRTEFINHVSPLHISHYKSCV